MKSKLKAAITSGMAADRAVATTMASRLAGLALRFLQPVGIALAGRGTSADRRRSSAARARSYWPSSNSSSSRCFQPMRIWWPQCAGRRAWFASSSRWKIIWLAGRAFLPEIVGRLGLAGERLQLRADEIGEPVLMGSDFRVSASRAAHAGGQLRAPARARPRRAPGFGPAGSVKPVGDAADQRRADDGGVGDAGDGGGLLRRLDAEADGDRQIGVALQALAPPPSRRRRPPSACR